MVNLQSIILFGISYFIFPRLTFLPKSVHSILVIFGPFLLPRLVNLFNTARATSRSVPVRPVPHNVQWALNALFVSAVAWLILSLPRFASENIFLTTESRLQIEANTLFARLKLMRPLTAEDEVLRTKFAGSMQNRLVYLTFGPDTLANCIWCTTSGGDDMQNYLLYYLPEILTPHIFHLAVLGLATSSMVGSESSRFRIHVTIAGLVLAVAEFWYLATYDATINKRAKTLQDIDFVHWRLRVLRYIAFALTDGALGLVLWLTSTNRWLAKPVSLAERLELATRLSEETRNQLRALGILSNSINRAPALRAVKENYWRDDADFMAETVQDEAVMEQIKNSMNSMDIGALRTQVAEMAKDIVAGFDVFQPPQAPAESETKAESSF
ncbi:hypothetical protein B0J11DRAFT_298238 [Dendryphion nanum]|uniref:Uncharacterized protein n=1 Tax=Dendryphion nanum TaxID=256645 RepID=A0A9P9DTQ6_9PLEO|nr:hypothetical protein B0J11DRAFT_298238 [Dendryphion nanum]